jgi:hypothetical protein
MRAITGIDRHHEFLKFQPATGLQISATAWSEEYQQKLTFSSDSLVSFAKELWPIGEAAHHEPRVNEVELIRKHPKVLGIIDNESQVGRNAEGLS